jgi:membrane-associated phospholipid phosphatase
MLLAHYVSDVAAGLMLGVVLDFVIGRSLASAAQRRIRPLGEGTLARSYEFAERLSNFTEPFRKRRQQKE